MPNECQTLKKNMEHHHGEKSMPHGYKILFASIYKLDIKFYKDFPNWNLIFINVINHIN